MKLQKDTVTTKQYEEAKIKWEQESKKAIEKPKKKQKIMLNNDERGSVRNLVFIFI